MLSINYKNKPTREEILLLLRYLELFPGWDNVPAKYNYACLYDGPSIYVSEKEPLFVTNDPTMFPQNYDKGYWSIDYSVSDDISFFTNSVILFKEELFKKLENNEKIGNIGVGKGVIKKLLSTNNIKSNFMYIEIPTGSISIYEPSISKIKRITYTDMNGKLCEGVDEHYAHRFGDLEVPYISLCKIKRPFTFEKLISDLKKEYNIKESKVTKDTKDTKQVAIVEKKPSAPKGSTEAKIFKKVEIRQFKPLNLVDFRTNVLKCSQNDFAKILGVTRSTYQHWERDSRIPVEYEEKLASISKQPK